MTRVVQLLRVTQTAYDELVRSLQLCGDEGQRRIMNGSHLNMDGLILEVDHSIHLRFPQEDKDESDRIFDAYSKA